MAKRKQEEEQDQLEKLEARVTELEGDLRRIVEAASVQFGDGPFRRTLRDIISKKQGK